MSITGIDFSRIGFRSAPFTTTCLEAGIDVRTVAEWLGHKDHGALLLKTYSHVRPEHEREMVAKVTFGMTVPPSVPSPAAT